jgi:hypothetical protein
VFFEIRFFDIRLVELRFFEAGLFEAWFFDLGNGIGCDIRNEIRCGSGNEIGFGNLGLGLGFRDSGGSDGFHSGRGRRLGRGGFDLRGHRKGGEQLQLG